MTALQHFQTDNLAPALPFRDGVLPAFCGPNQIAMTVGENPAGGFSFFHGGTA